MSTAAFVPGPLPKESQELLIATLERIHQEIYEELRRPQGEIYGRTSVGWTPVAPVRPDVKTETGTTYTVDGDDEGDMILFTAACTITLPADSTEDLPIGYLTHLHQDGASQITVAGGVGVTVNSSEGTLKTRKQYSALSVVKVAANEWNLIGDQELAP